MLLVSWPSLVAMPPDAYADLTPFFNPVDFDAAFPTATIEDFNDGILTGANISGPIDGSAPVLDAVVQYRVSYRGSGPGGRV